jgi:hypothetical protein
MLPSWGGRAGAARGSRLCESFKSTFATGDGMVTYQQVSDAVDAVLTDDRKQPDDTQVMQDPPYNYNNKYLVQDFFSDVSAKLKKIGVVFNGGDLDSTAFMAATVLQVKEAIYTDLTA